MKIFADILFNLGNAFNLVQDTKISNQIKKPLYIKDDEEAIREAWNNVGEELSKILPK